MHVSVIQELDKENTTNFLNWKKKNLYRRDQWEYSAVSSFVPQLKGTLPFTQRILG